MARLRSLAEAASGGASLPPRFDDAELLRYAGHHGYFAARRTPAQREAAVRGGAAAAAATVAWLRRHAFASEAELDSYHHLISWEEAPPPPREPEGADEGIDAAHAAAAAEEEETDKGAGDPSGRRQQRRLPPTLRVCIGRAMTECRGPAAAAFGRAVITQMERAVSGGRLQNAAPLPAPSDSASGGSGSTESGAAEDVALAAGGGVWDAARGQVVVVLDMGGGTLVSGSRSARVITDVAATLNTHYPGRCVG